MKNLILSLFLVFTASAFTQSKEHAGNYEFALGDVKDHFETYKLTLNPNGTFLFSWYRYVEKGIPKEERKYGKGMWTSKKHLIFLKVDDSDVDATHVLNLDNSKLRYDAKSPRDKSNRDIKTSVRFYASRIFWIKGKTLVKNLTVSLKKDGLKCCKTVKEVESLLNGKWKRKDSPENRVIHYTFNNGQGTLDVYETNDNGELVSVNQNPANIKILKTEDGFKIEQDFDGLSTFSKIKHLDSKKLIAIRRDGKEGELIRIKE